MNDAFFRAAGPLLLVLAWWQTIEWGLISERVIPGPQAVFVHLLSDLSGTAWPHIRTTMVTAGLGLALGVAIGAILAGALWSLPRTQHFLSPYIIFVNAMPRLALAPLFILWFGIGISSKVALGVSLVGFVTFLSVYSGLLGVRKDRVNALKLMGARPYSVWKYLRLPTALPFFLSSLRVNIALAILAAVAGEMLISTEGLGWMLRRRSQALNLDGTFSIIVILAAIGMAVNELSAWAQRGSERWQ